MSSLEADLAWLALSEEALLFDDALVQQKFNDLDAAQRAEEFEPVATAHEADAAPSDEREQARLALPDLSNLPPELTLHAAGLVPSQQAHFLDKATERWSRDLAASCSAPVRSSSSFESAIRRRVAVQKHLHHLLAKSSQSPSKPFKRSDSSDLAQTKSFGDTAISVPVTLRLGVLSIFPILKALHNVPGVDNGRVSSDILALVNGAVGSLPPLSLQHEPRDVLDAFRDFCYDQVAAGGFVLDSPGQASAVAALVSLAVARGGSTSLLQAVSALFNIMDSKNAENETEMQRDEVPLPLGPVLKRLREFEEAELYPMATDTLFEDEWTVEAARDVPAPPVKAAVSDSGKSAQSPPLPQESQRHSALASNGDFLFLFAATRGLLKIGTGSNGTIRGHVYASRSDLVSSDPVSLAVIGQELILMATPPSTPVGGAVEVSVLDTVTLADVRRLRLATKTTEPSSRRLLSDGHFLYLVGRTDHSKASEGRSGDAPVQSDSGSDSVLRFARLVSAMRGGRDEESSSEESDSDDDEDDEVDIEEEHDELQNAEASAAVALERRLLERYREALESDLTRSQQIEATEQARLIVRESGAKYSVEVFGALASSESEIQPTRVVALTGKDITVGDKKTTDAALLPHEFNGCSLYADGRHIVFLVPPPLARRNVEGTRVSLALVKAHVFALSDGHLVKEHTLASPLAAPLSVAFVEETGVLYGFAPLTLVLSSWRSRSPPLASTADAESATSSYSLDSPESFFPPSSPVNEAQPVPAATVALFLVAQLDRLARHHPLYALSVLARADHTDTDHSANSLGFYSDGDVAVFRHALAILKHAKAMKNRHLELRSELVYVLCATLRLVKINLFEIARSHASLSAAVAEIGAALLNELREELLAFASYETVGDEMDTDASSTHRVRNCAVDALCVGFPLIFESSEDQCAWLLAITSQPERRLLLERLFSALADSSAVSDLLCSPVSDTKKSDQNVHGQARPFLAALVNAVAHEAEVSMGGVISAKDTPRISPSARLLLALQRDILRGKYSSTFLLEYSAHVVETSEKLVEVATSKLNTENAEVVEVCLEQSLLGVILRSLVTALSRKAFLSRSDFATALSDKIGRLARAVNAINCKLPRAKTADVSFVSATRQRREERRTAECWHPYPPGKQRTQTTITLPGARALALRFDARSRTASTANDLVQVYLGPGTAELLTTNGRAANFSGTNFPKAPLYVPGDSVTIVFTSSSRHGSDVARWGFRVDVTEAASAHRNRPRAVAHWLLELQCSLVLLGGRMALTLVDETSRESPAMPSKALLSGGLEGDVDDASDFATTTALLDLSNDVLEELVPVNVYQKLAKLSPSRPVIPPSAAGAVERVERLTLAAMIHHEDARNSLTDEALQQPNEVVKKATSKARNVATWLLQRAQVQREWLVAVSERRSLSSLDEMRQQPQRLKELCKVKGVEYDPHDASPALRQLHALIVEEADRASKAGVDVLVTNAYDAVAKGVDERLRILLCLASAGNSDDVTAFACESSMTFKDCFKILHTRTLRAHRRVQGMKALLSFLQASSFAAPRQQLLGVLSASSCLTTHCLSQIEGVKADLRSEVKSAFRELCVSLFHILGNKEADSASRMLTLGVLGASFHSEDAALLLDSNLFALLASVVAEGGAIDDEGDEAGEISLTASLHDLSPEGAEAQRHRALCVASWTAFRLLSARCFSWKVDGPNTIVSFRLREHILSLLGVSIGSLGRKLQAVTVGSPAPALSRNEDAEINEQLELLCLLADNGDSTQLAKLASVENLHVLLGFLGSNASPRAQRSVMRLLRHLLPLAEAAVVPAVFDALWRKSLPWMLHANSALARAPSAINMKKSSGSLLDDADEGEDEEDEGADSPWCLQLHAWSFGDKRLVELCAANGGADALGNVAIAPGAARSSPQSEAQAQSLLQEMTAGGSATLHTGAKNTCQKLATVLAAAGATVTVGVAPRSSLTQRDSKADPNASLSAHWPQHWVDGRAAAALAAEHMDVVRVLSSSALWAPSITNSLTSSLQSLPELVDALHRDGGSMEAVQHALFGMGVLGAFDEPVRLGGRVLVSEYDDLPMEGVLVNFVPGAAGKVDILFLDEDSDTLTATGLSRVPLSAVQPVQATRLSEQVLSAISTAFVGPLLHAATSPAPSDELSDRSRWLISELRVRVMALLELVVQSRDFAQAVLSSSACSQLVESALDASSGEKAKFSVASHQRIVELLWNSQTRPPSGTSSRMASLAQQLPFSPLAQKSSELLPTRLRTPSALAGLMYHGNAHRSVEYVAAQGSSRNARSPHPAARGLGRSPPASTEIVLQANAPLPLSGDYYFEMMVDAAPNNALISIGIAPEGANEWGAHSYRYQANKLKTWFVRGNRRQEGYGVFFSASHTVGCGWRHADRSLYFTRNGEELGVAFPDVSLGGERLTPTFGLGRGVRISLNFGQRKFVYSPVDDAQLDQTERQRLREEAAAKLQAEVEAEENRRKAEREAEEAARKEAAQPILNMGYTLKQALKALEITGFQGPEPAVIWLLENPDFPFEEEESAPVKEEKPTEIPAPPPPPSAATPAPPVDTGDLGAGAYRVSASAAFDLASPYVFKDTPLADGTDSGSAQVAFGVSPEWEERVLPDLKAFMERDGFSRFEVSEYLQQIRNWLAEGNEAQAGEDVMQIVGEAIPDFHLPAAAAANSARSPDASAPPAPVRQVQPVKLDQLRVGSTVVIKRLDPRTASASIKRLWRPNLAALVGCMGQVRDVDSRSKLVRVACYDPEAAILQEWWFPLVALALPVSTDTTALKAAEEAEQRVVEVCELRSRILSRRVLLALAPYVDPSATALSLDRLLVLASREFSSVLGDCSNDPLAVMLASHLPLESRDARVSEMMFKSCGSALQRATKAARDTVTLSLDTERTVAAEVKDATALSLTLERGGANVKVFRDAHCTDLVGTLDTVNARLVSVPGPTVHLRLHSTSASAKLRVAVSAATSDIPLACWLVKMLSEHENLSVDQWRQLFDGVLCLLFAMPVPTVQKAFLLSSTARALQTLLARGNCTHPVIAALAVERAAPLLAELEQLHTAEQKRSKVLYSGYLQSLIEFGSTVVLCTKELEPSAPLPTPEGAAPPLPQDPEMFAALSIVKNLFADGGRAQGEPMEGVEPTSASPVIENEMKVEVSGDVEIDMVDDEEGSVSDEGSMSGDSYEGSDMDEDDDDEAMLVRALAMSMRDQNPQATSNIDSNQSPKNTPRESTPAEGDAMRALFKSTEAVPVSDQARLAPTVEAPAWLHDVITAQALLQYFAGCPLLRTFTQSLHSSISSAWQATQSASVNPRLALLGRVPPVPKASVAEYELWLSGLIATAAISAGLKVSVVRVWLLIDPAHTHRRRTLPWCVLELSTSLSSTHFASLASAISKQHRTIASKLGASKLPKKERAYELIAFAANDARVLQWQRSLLFSDESKAITEPCRAALTEIFSEFAGSPEGVLSGPDLDRLQMASCGEEFGAENIEYTLSNYDVAAVGDKKGLTLKGFLTMYTAQCAEEPSETWAELHKLGYDIYLQRGTYSAFEEAQSVLVPVADAMDIDEDGSAVPLRAKVSSEWGLPLVDPLVLDASPPVASIDEEVVRYVEEVVLSLRGTENPTLLDLTLLSVPKDASAQLRYPRIVAVGLRELWLRFELLRFLNQLMARVLPLVDLSGESSLAQLVRECRPFLFLATRMTFVHGVLAETVTSEPPPSISVNRLKLAARTGTEKDERAVVRNSIFGSAWQQLKAIPARRYRQPKPTGSEPHLSFKVDFRGEHVAGEGGPYRQLFTDIAKELRTEKVSLLVQSGNFHVLAPSQCSRLRIRLFRFLGQLMGMALRTGALLTLDLASLVWKPLISAPLDVNDLNEIDPGFVTFMRYLKNCPPEDLIGAQRSIFQTFTIPLSDRSTRSLIPNGANVPVTPENRDEYVSEAVPARLCESVRQARAVQAGLAELIPAPLLPLLDWQELRTRVSGDIQIDVELLRRHTEYSGVSSSSPHVVAFWKVLEDFTQEQRRAFVRFAWAQERLPSSDAEFARTGTRMMIKPFNGNGGSEDHAFPKADTCFFNLMLPAYSTPDILRERLLFAIYTDADSMNADAPSSDDDRNMPGGARRRQGRPLGFLDFIQ